MWGDDSEGDSESRTGEDGFETASDGGVTDSESTGELSVTQAPKSDRSGLREASRIFRDYIDLVVGGDDSLSEVPGTGVDRLPMDDPIRDHPTRIEVIADVVEFSGVTNELPIETPDPDALREEWFDFSYLRAHEEVERYWVNEPYAYVSILRSDVDGELHYRVTEPALGAFEEYILEELTRILRNNLMYEDLGSEAERASTFDRRVIELIDDHTASLSALSIHKLAYYLRRDFVGYERIDPLLSDDAVEDISCDGRDLPVFVYHRDYRDLDTNITFGESDLRSFVTRLAQRAGKHLSVSNPLVDASLPDGSRVQLTFGGEIATRGPNFTIRQFSSVPDTPIDLINWGTFSVEQMAYLWLAIENNRSLMFAGGTGAGKTTSLNAVSFFIPKKSKIVSIEDTQEVSLPHENWVQSLTRESATADGSGEVTMYQQLQTALRQRPEYLLVGEIRTESRVALTFFQAMATGHTAYTTVHSESVMGVINRLENEPLSVPTQMIKELDIISIQKQVLLGDERVRRNQNITELISGGEGDDILANEVFEWNPRDDSYNEKFDSNVLDEIAADRGWSAKQLQSAIDGRKRVLEYLLENDITWWEDVARVIHSFIENEERVLEEIENGELQSAGMLEEGVSDEGIFEDGR
ncbi:type II/IV secretion system ATPase subunit [Natronomonas sp. CBA1123]|jgi:flagellar protein FlaI|uniref:type II/IV secretion system ATPase subunit n=1 Tax=Natronomonas sp. CBA1123 TaxID=2668070 RepID=UPI0018D21E6A|nr:type II/IV secretion system ATPase subunit [Natronomonas sp. CBA1123]